jgi:hypothetical protein
MQARWIAGLFPSGNLFHLDFIRRNGASGGNEKLIADDKATLTSLRSVIRKIDTLTGAAQESLKDQQRMSPQSKLDV